MKLQKRHFTRLNQKEFFFTKCFFKTVLALLEKLLHQKKTASPVITSETEAMINGTYISHMLQRMSPLSKATNMSCYKQSA